MKIISISLNLLYLISGLFTYLLNPGTIYRYGKNKKKKYCKECNYEYPFHKKLSHCYSGGICVIGIDHHCGVFGKCILGKTFFGFILLLYLLLFLFLLLLEH